MPRLTGERLAVFQEKLQKVKEAYEAGKTCKEILKSIPGATPYDLLRVTKDNNLSRKRGRKARPKASVRHKDIDTMAVLEDIKAGLTIREIGNKYKINWKHIISIARQYNVTVKTNTLQYMRYSVKKRVKPINTYEPKKSELTTLSPIDWSEEL